MNILWLDINASYSHASLALPALHAQVINNPLLITTQWSVVRGSIKSDPNQLLEQVLSEEPQLILASLWLFTHEYVVSLLARIKALLPTSCIVLGGPEFLGDNQSFLERNPFVDAVFRGEGEEFLPQWLPMVKEKNRWKEVTGLCFLTEAGYHDGVSPSKVINRGVVNNFTELRFPEESPFFVTDRSFVQLETTRGCFNSCEFCVSGGDKPIRSLSLEQIKKRLDFFLAQGIESIRLLDRTFNGNSKRSIELLELMRSYEGKLAFHLEVHPSLLRPELREALQQMPAGILHLEAGIQSLQQEVLDACNRYGNVDTALDGLTFLFSLEKQMETHTDLIAGIPLYSYAALVEDVKKLLSMGAGEIQLETLKVLPGTVMRYRASELGLQYAPTPPYEILATPHISYKELRRAMLLSRLLDVYYNHAPWRTLFQRIALHTPQSLEQCLDHFSVHKDKIFSATLETQGRLLYGFIANSLPHYLAAFEEQWINNGLPLKKLPGLIELLPMQSYLEKLDYAVEERKEYRCYRVATAASVWMVVYDKRCDGGVPTLLIAG
ncbi:MAG: B12-binding domain-containing radical SAM protein [Phocaeicola sp.]